MSIFFYLPTHDLRQVEHQLTTTPRSWSSPAQVWIWSTFLRLQKTGLDCQLTDVFPHKGIVVASACTLPLNQPTSPQVCHISTVADSPPRFYPQIQVTQNPFQAQLYGQSFALPKWVHIPHWPQPDLIPRDSCRGDRFETIGFLGHRDQLAAELRTLEVQKRLQELGLKLLIREDNFQNYADLDAVLAVRSFDGNPYAHKPATKLINAWQAGVPAILGAESAYRAIRESWLDFVEVNSLESCLSALHNLKQLPALRQAMVTNGQHRVQDWTEEAITRRWLYLLTVEAPQVYETWQQRGTLFHRAFHVDQYLRRMGRSLHKRLRPYQEQRHYEEALYRGQITGDVRWLGF